jgi:hypothetical protein
MNQAPFVTIPLRDGAQASVALGNVRVGARVYAISAIQDARQVAPDPVTVALRVANERHVVELQPVEPGDAALLLEAIFRLRPELRPAGFDPPATIPAGFPPAVPVANTPLSSMAPSAWGAHPSWPPQPGLYPPPPYVPTDSAPTPQPGSDPGFRHGYRPASAGPQRLADGRLTAIPRSVPELLSGTFELFKAHWRRWLLLGLVALLLPQVLAGVLDTVFHLLGGGDLWAGLPMTQVGTTSGAFAFAGTSPPTGSALLLVALDLLAMAAASTLIAGWVAAVLGSASRDALLGGTPHVGSALRLGVRRAFPAIIASVLSGLFVLLILAPFIALYGIIVTQFGRALVNPNSLDPASEAAATFTVLGCLFLLVSVPCLGFAVYANFRLVLAPYIVATESLGPIAALRRSWSLTQRQWWHTALPIIMIIILTNIIAIPAGFVEYLSFGVAALVITPLVAALTAPLTALAVVGVLYDLRLQREGYASLAHEGTHESEPLSTPT